MNTEPKHIDLLQNLEFAALEIWRRHREMSDHVGARAHAAACERDRAEARGRQPKSCVLTGLDREVCEAVTASCEFRLGRAAPADRPREPIPPVPVAEPGDCLRARRRSVERPTRSAGRQGCLTFVDGFLP